jgi:glycogen debranching enzyme
VSFNALLAMANDDLAAVAAEAGVELPPALRARFAATPAALESLWSEELGTYCAHDAVTGARLDPPTIAAFTVLGAGTRPDRRDRLVAQLETAAWWPAHPVPSIGCDRSEFDSRRYWSGPTWVNTNWLLVHGLRRHGATERAEELRRATVDLAARHGCAEYFSPVTGAPLGAREFSWTAALVLDLATEPAG